jgi:hypothetical protein
MKLMTRYRDAYWAARAINGTGQTIKVLGIALAIVLTLAGWVAASSFGVAFGFAALIFGAVVGIPVYVLGVIVAAQGQILKATLDTAVNSSPLLSRDEVREIMSLDAGPRFVTAAYGANQLEVKSAQSTAEPLHPPASQTTCGRCRRAFPSHFYLEQASDGNYLCEQCRQGV